MLRHAPFSHFHTALRKMAIELKHLTKRSENYSQWYNDLVVMAGLAEQSPVRGCMVIKPYGYAIDPRPDVQGNRRPECIFPAPDS